MTTPPVVIRLLMQIQQAGIQQGLAIANGDHHAAAHHHREGIAAIADLVDNLDPGNVAAAVAAMAARDSRQAATR